MFLAGLLLFASAGQDLSEPVFRKRVVDNAEFRRQQFIAAGLMPIEEAARRRRNIRRLRLWVWLPANPPVMEIERHHNKKVTLLLTWRDKPSERHFIPASIWEELKSLDKDVFAPPAYDLKRIGIRPEGSVSCHGDIADFEASIGRQVRSAGAAQCFPRLESFDPAKLAAIKVFTQAAVASRNECQFDDARPADSFVKCFR